MMREGRLAGIDGLRAVAVLGVVLFHARLAGAQLGWAGVELFFVISGFLITRILLELRPHPRYLQIFYARRALRILPVYYVVVLVSVMLALAAGRSPASLDLPFYVVYLQNYFPQIPSEMNGGIPLTSHTWTLAVEEQFYWLWPLVILIAGSRTLRVIVVACVIGAPITRLVTLLVTANSFVMVATLPAQVDALAVGAALALAERAGVARGILRTWATVAIVGGAALLVLLVATGGGLDAFAETRTWGTAPVNALLLTAFAALFGGVVTLTAFEGGRALRILEWRPLVHIGRISYGLYIYNPLGLLIASLVITPFDPSAAESVVAIALGTALTYVLALISWRYMETPLLRRRRTIA